MNLVYTCLVERHDLRLAVLVGLICLLASWTTLSLARRGMGVAGRVRSSAWLAAAALVAGCGVWATHFIAALAYDAGLPVGYDPALTLLSTWWRSWS